MKRILRLLPAFLLLASPQMAKAYSFALDGIYYNIISESEVEVTYESTSYNSYSGDVSIPDSVTFISYTFAVTTIGDYAFYNCSDLTSVSLPDDITTIGDYAFYGCSDLTSLYLPDDVTTIGDYAFYGCSSLTSIPIGEAVTTIGDYAFYDCSKLTSISFGNSLTTIGDHAFQSCSSLTGIDIPDGVTTIGSYTFQGCSSLTTINIPDGVTTIGSYTFQGCSSLTSINIPDGVTTIERYAFSQCSGLTSVYIPNGVTALGDHAFFKCSSMNTITLGEAMETIGSYAFNSCSNLLDIICKGTTPPTCNSTNSFPNYYATVYVPEGCSETYAATSVWEDFSDIIEYTDANNILFEKDGINYAVISSEDVKVTVGNYNGSIIIPETITYNDKTYSVSAIGNYAFYSCSSLTSITFGDAVTSIGNYAFYSCTSLTNITIGDAVTSIGNYAFYSCRKLSDIICKGTTPPTCTSTKSFWNYYATLYVPEGSSETYAATSVWEDFSDVIEYTDANNILFEKDGINYAVICSGEVKVTAGNYSGSITIPETITYNDKTYSVSAIGNYSFSNSNKLTTITIGENVTTIGVYAIANCTSLTSVRIPDAVTEIGNSAFSYCSGLTDIVIGESVKVIGEYAFWYCSKLTSVIIPYSVTTINNGAFYPCGNITDVYSLNPTPPTCGSSDCFGSSTYNSATLHVPTESVSDYASATSWERFINISGEDLTAVTSITADGEEAQPTGYYSLSGQRIDAPSENAVTIIRYSDGTAKKVFMK